MNSKKRQKYIRSEEKSLRSEVCNMLLGKNRGQLLRVTERMKRLGQSANDAQLWICLVVKVKFNAIKNNIA